MLPAEDREYLVSRFPQFRETMEGQMICVVLRDFPLPSGLRIPLADLLLRLPPGYPDIAPDMWWFDPPIVRGDGQAFPQTETREQHLGRTWQRWSRHFDGGQWRPGVDSIETYLSLVHRELGAAA